MPIVTYERILKSGFNRKNICIISQYWWPDVNGDVVRLDDMVKTLTLSGYEITLITTFPHYPLGQRKKMKAKFMSMERKKNLKVLRLAMPKFSHNGFGRRLFLYLWFSSMAALCTIILGKCKYIWAFSQRVFSTYAALPAKVLWNAKLISDVTDVWPEALVNTGYARLNSITYKIGRVVAKIAYGISDRITTLTKAMANMFYHNYKIKLNKISVVPTIGRFSDINEHQDEEKSTKTFTVLYYGNMGANYDFNTIFKIAKLLEPYNVIFTFKGSGERLKGIIKTVNELGIKNVKIDGKIIISKSELFGLVSNADMLLLPMGNHIYPDASFPTKFIEYLWLGKPIIHVGRGYVAELVNEYKIGISKEPEGWKEIVDFIIKIKNCREELERMGIAARKLAKALFSEEIIKQSLLQVFE